MFTQSLFVFTTTDWITEIDFELRRQLIGNSIFTRFWLTTSEENLI